MDTLDPIRGFNPLTDVNVNEKFWRGMPASELETYIDFLTDYFHTQGYPFFERLSTEELQAVTDGIVKYGLDRILETVTVEGTEQKIVRQTMHGLAALWAYFPHSVMIKCNDGVTPFENFSDRAKLRRVIAARLKHGSYMAASSLRKALRLYGGAQAVSNFRPTAAGAIYQYAAKILGLRSISTWDMSSGFGGRLYGAFLSGVVNWYIGCDPSIKTSNGLLDLKRDLYDIKLRDSQLSDRMRISLFNTGSEDMKLFLADKSVDVCFTSPPYFNTEHYADEASQSYLRFPTYDTWLRGYWTQTVKNCRSALNKGGLLIVNIAPIKKVQTLHTDVFDIMVQNGFAPVETLALQLSGRPGTALYKYEPVYVLRKTD